MGAFSAELFEPPEDAIYTIEATSRLVNVSRGRIPVYCKHHLVSPANGTADHGYYFDRDAIHTLRRIETLRTVCNKDFAGSKIILDLTAALERLRRDKRLLSPAKGSDSMKRIRGRVVLGNGVTVNPNSGHNPNATRNLMILNRNRVRFLQLRRFFSRG
jgi:hypothetical protein